VTKCRNDVDLCRTPEALDDAEKEVAAASELEQKRRAVRKFADSCGSPKRSCTKSKIGCLILTDAYFALGKPARKIPRCPYAFEVSAVSLIEARSLMIATQ
jgi:hypothetical protein